MYEVMVEKTTTLQVPDLIESVIKGEEIVFTQNFADALPRLFAPVVIVGQLLERDLIEADPARVSARAGRDTFAFVVREHFLEGVGQQFRSRFGAGVAEEIEREEDRTSRHVSTPIVKERIGTIGTNRR